MAGRRDQSETPIVTGSELAERHGSARRTSKTRRPRDSSVAPPIRANQPRRGRRGQQQDLPFYGGAGGNVVTVRKRTLGRIIPDGFGPRLARVVAALVFIGLLFGGLIFGLYLFGGSRFFALRDVEIEGNSRLSDQEIKRMIESATMDGVWRVRLKDIREELRKHDLVEDAEITRVLPDKIHVILKEREPYTLARRGDKLVCVDRNGMMFGTAALLKGTAIPPLVSGLVESGENIIEENRKRMLMYQQLLRELDNAEPQLSPRIDEVIFDDEMNIRLILKDSRVAVMVGQEDFRTRLNSALDVLDAVRRKDAEALQVLKIEDAQRLLSGSRIAYLNATIPKRVIVGLAE